MYVCTHMLILYITNISQKLNQNYIHIFCKLHPQRPNLISKSHKLKKYIKNLNLKPFNNYSIFYNDNRTQGIYATKLKQAFRFSKAFNENPGWNVKQLGNRR